MQIYGPFRLSTTQSTSSVQGAGAPKPSDRLAGAASIGRPSATPVDQLDLSSSAVGVNRLDATSKASGGEEIRVDRVAELRRQIASGNYDTQEKLDIALDRMLDQFA